MFIFRSLFKAYIYIYIYLIVVVWTLSSSAIFCLTELLQRPLPRLTKVHTLLFIRASQYTSNIIYMCSLQHTCRLGIVFHVPIWWRGGCSSFVGHPAGVAFPTGKQAFALPQLHCTLHLHWWECWLITCLLGWLVGYFLVRGMNNPNETPWFWRWGKWTASGTKWLLSGCVVYDLVFAVLFWCLV